MESILTSIKKLLGIAEEYNNFDADIIMHINTAFTSLNQIGVGPSEGFMIFDDKAVWNDYIDIEKNKNFNSIKTYIYLKVKLVFDPPSNSVTIQAMKDEIKEIEWRLNIRSETK